MTAKGPRRLAAEDDLLKGFDQTGPGRGEFRGFFATLIVASLWAWDLAFAYGAYHTLFFHNRHHLFVLSLVVLLGVLMVHRRVRVHRWVLAAFAPAILLTLLRLLIPVESGVSTRSSVISISNAGPAVRVVEAGLVMATILTSPIVVWVIARLVAPNYFALPGRRIKIVLVLTVATVALTGYLVGRYNYRFLTCEEFLVAGDAAPTNCVHKR